MVKRIEEEEKQRKSVKEVPVEGGKPTSRANFTMIAHPDNPELVFFGGEFHNGKTVNIEPLSNQILLQKIRFLVDYFFKGQNLNPYCTPTGKSKNFFFTP